jgi:hypothetical protein
MENLEPGKYYHIYNKTINNEILFRSEENYRHFLSLYGKYIYPIAETFAWALMINHFHYFIKNKRSSRNRFLQTKK